MSSQHIIGLQAENVKRLTAIKITPDPKSGTVVLAGENAQGKSSVLDCICMALMGKSEIPKEPIRTGKNSAFIILETEEFVIKRTFKRGEKDEVHSYLTVENKDGFGTTSPQKLLDSMYSTVAFDPLAFARMDPPEQSKTLLKIFPTKIDLNQNANFHAAAYASRREANGVVKLLENQLQGYPAPEAGTPTVEISVSALASKMTELQAVDLANQNRAHKLQKLRETLDRKKEHLADLEKEIVDARADIASSQLSLENAESEEVVDPANEIAAVTHQIKNAEEINRKIRAVIQRAKMQADLDKAIANAKKYDDQISTLAKQRSDALAEAKFPVEGLSIGEEGMVTFNGVPFKQASEAQKIMVGVAVAAAATPKLRVCMIRDGSLLDKKSMALVMELALKNDLQIWMERVEDNSPTAIQIVEGSNIGVKETEDDSKQATELSVDSPDQTSGGLFGKPDPKPKGRGKKAPADADAGAIFRA